MGPFGPNSNILLKAGDTWTAETFAPPAGSFARYDENAYLSAYNSTFTTNQAAYIAGTLTPPNSLPTFSQFKTALINAGESSAAADADATEYCRRLAMQDAILAGHAAAQASSSWITFGRYGAGANPILDGNVTANFAIDLSGSDRHQNSGWKIIDIDVKNYLVSAIRAEGSSTGFWITASTPGGATIRDITGVGFNATTHTLNTPIPGYDHFTALGIDLNGAKYACVENYNVINTDTPWFVIGANDSLVRSMTATTSYYLHPYFGVSLSRQLCKSCIIDTMCTVGLASGRAGVIIASSIDVIFLGTEIKNCRGDSIDLEGHCDKTSIFACNVHDGEAAAILENSNTGQNTGTMIVGNTFANSPTCTTCDSGVPCLVQTGGGSQITADHMLWVQNTITKHTGHAFLFAGGDHTGPTNTITDWITQGIFGADNSVS